MAESKLIVTINDDGTVNLDARGVRGSEKQILDQLEGLTAMVGGELTVEKHVESHHHHHHHDTHEKHHH